MNLIMDVEKFCFITCVNYWGWYSERLLYLKHLDILYSMQAEYIEIHGVASMASVYNSAKYVLQFDKWRLEQRRYNQSHNYLSMDEGKNSE